MGKRTWTDGQVEKLGSLWGTKSYRHIARATGHTETAVRLKAKRLGLGAVKDAADCLCSREVARIMGVDSHTVTDYWIRKLGLKHRRIQSRNRTLWVLIRQDHLMEFLEAHQDIWDSRRVEPYGLGSEPGWLHEKRLAERKKGDASFGQEKRHH